MSLKYEPSSEPIHISVVLKLMHTQERYLYDLDDPYWVWLERCRRPCLVANRATLPQKWPPPPRNVANLCELTATTKPQERYLYDPDDPYGDEWSSSDSDDYVAPDGAELPDNDA